MEDYWSYETASVGMNGTASVNAFNGNLVVTENVLSTTGSRLPVGISLVYNSNNHLDPVSYTHLFEMAYKTDGLTPVQVDAHTIALQNEEGETVYTLSAPVMTDAEGASSDALTLTLKDVKNKKFTVELTADDTWLDAEDRVYPVKIDPDTSANGTDLLVFSFNTGTYDVSHSEEILIGKGDSSMGQYDIYVKAQSLPTPVSYTHLIPGFLFLSVHTEEYPRSD